MCDPILLKESGKEKLCDPMSDPILEASYEKEIYFTLMKRALGREDCARHAYYAQITRSSTVCGVTNMGKPLTFGDIESSLGGDLVTCSGQESIAFRPFDALEILYPDDDFGC